MDGPVEPKQSSPFVLVVGIAAAVGLAVIKLVSGPAAIAAIVAICLRTDAGAIIDKLKGKQ